MAAAAALHAGAELRGGARRPRRKQKSFMKLLFASYRQLELRLKKKVLLKEHIVQLQNVEYCVLLDFKFCKEWHCHITRGATFIFKVCLK